MKKTDRPELSQVRQAFTAAASAWWKRESTDAVRRRFAVLAVIITLAALGPSFIALPIFSDPPTFVNSDDARRCTYDAVPEPAPSRFAPPTPMPIVSGQSNQLALHVRNSGTCSWDSAVTLRRESNALSDEPEVIPVTETAANAFFNTELALTAPDFVNAVYTLRYRMYTPDGRSFGTPLTLSVITHANGVDPIYPTRPLLAIDNLITFALLVLPGLLGLGVAIDRAGRFVRDFYSLESEAHGRAFALRRLFGFGSRASATATAGSIEWNANNETLDKIGGPGSLSIHGGTAVLLERGGKYSRIAGPGKTELGPFERVRKVIDARPLNRERSESAFTRDGIEVKTKTTVSFKLLKHREGERISKPVATPTWQQLLTAWGGGWLGKAKPAESPAELPASAQTIRAIVYEYPAGVNWERSAKSGIDEVIPDKMLDELWAPENPELQPRGELVEELLDSARDRLHKYGIELIDMSIGPLTVPAVVDEKRREVWQAAWGKSAKVTEAEGEAEALRFSQTVRAEAQAELIQAIAQSFRMMAMSGATPPSREVALRMLEVIARTMKATLEEAEEGEEAADKAVRILKQLNRLINA